jgi:cyclophilin family peptidyl-prolyl cis-trans isomerase
MPDKQKDILIYALFFAMLLVALGIFLFRNKSSNSQTGSTTPQLNKVANETTQSTSSGLVDNTTPSSTVNLNSTSENTGKPITIPEMTLVKGKTYQAVLHTTDGDITLDLYADKTPITVNNFVYLSKIGLYNSTKFHRIIKNFMIQGGDPNGDGTGGPGYKFNDEPFTGDYTPGTLAMANSGPNTNGSQFFIMDGTMQLPKSYVIFGKTADDKSLEVVHKIANTPVVMNQFQENSKPATEVLIKSVDILIK